MSVSLAEHRLGGLRWIVLNGPDREAFGALGEHVRGELAALAAAWPALPRLRRHVSGSPGRDVLAAVRRATAENFAAEWAELAAFADGANVQFDDLVLLNLRGDLGLTDGGIGCSDLGRRRERSVIAHNEDGALEDVGRCALLTVTGTGRPPVTTVATSPAPSPRPMARARPAARRWTPSASRRGSLTRPGSWTCLPARRPAASAPTPGQTATG